MREELLNLLAQHKKRADKHGMAVSLDATDMAIVFPSEDFVVVPGRGDNDEPVTFVIATTDKAQRFAGYLCSNKSSWDEFASDLEAKLAD